MASEALAGRRPWVVVWVVTWPLLITYLTQKVLTTVDTALLGQFSTSALASVGLAAPVYLGLGFMIWYGRRRLPAELELFRAKHVPAWRALVPRLWPVAWPKSTGLVIDYLLEVVIVGFVAALGTVQVAAYRVLLSPCCCGPGRCSGR